MKGFTELFTDLDQTTKTLGKIDALVHYFEKAYDTYMENNKEALYYEAQVMKSEGK